MLVLPSMKYADGFSHVKTTPGIFPPVKRERVAHPHETEDTIRYTLALDGQFQRFREKLLKHFEDKGFDVDDRVLNKKYPISTQHPSPNHLEFFELNPNGDTDRKHYVIQSVHAGNESQMPVPVTDAIAKVYPGNKYAEIVLDKKSGSFREVQQIVLETQKKPKNMHVFRLQGKAQLAALLTGIADHFEAKDMALYRSGMPVTDNEKLIVALSRESASPASNVQWKFSTGKCPDEDKSLPCATATVRGKYITVALNGTHEDFAALRQIALQAKQSTITNPDRTIEQRFSGAIQHLLSDEPQHTAHGEEFAALRLHKERSTPIVNAAEQEGDPTVIDPGISPPPLHTHTPRRSGSQVARYLAEISSRGAGTPAR